MSAQTKRPPRATLTNLGLDAALFTATLLALTPALTGLPIHEWLSLALAAAFFIHLLLHWSWIGQVLRRFLRRLPGSTRFNALLNLALFVDFTVLTFTGLAISRAALPLLGFTLARNEMWTGLHRLSADLSIYIMGLHVAVHWKWIVSAARRYLFQPLLTLGRQPAPAPVLAALPTETDR